MSDFDRITEPAEISRILALVTQPGIEIFCQIDGAVRLPQSSREIDLEVRAVYGYFIVLGLRRPPGKPAPLLSAVFGDTLKAGLQIEVIFNLIDGQFAIHDQIVDLSLSTFTVDASKSLLKLQRRRDFRVSVKSNPVFFVLGDPKIDEERKKAALEAGKQPDPETPKPQLPLVDLSAGGMRLHWTAECGPPPVVKGRVVGTLLLPTGARPVLEAELIKSHGPVTADAGAPVSLSFQFVQPGQNEARAVLFACLQIHRRSYAG